MNASPHDLEHLLAEAWRMPYGRAQVTAVEEVIRHADAQQLSDLQYAARILAISAYTDAGERAKSFVPFAWCLAVHDRGDADPSYDHSLMGAFKHVVSGLTTFPEVPLDRTYAVLDDMERRYRLAGHSMNPVHMLRTEVADHVGDRETAAEQYRLWGAAPRGELSDCIGCEPTQKAWHLLKAEQYDDALAVAAPVLTGSLSCVEQPAAILTALLEPYVRTGRYAEAADAHRRAYRQLQTSRSDLGAIGRHIGFCARTGNVPRAVELVQRHAGWLDEPSTPMADLMFSACSAHALRLAGDAPVRTGGAERRAAEFGEELAARATALAERFDARNGTSAVGDWTTEQLNAEPLADAVPLSGPARRKASPTPVQEPAPTPTPTLPTDPQALIDWTALQECLHNDQAVETAWARFDELCPEPTGVLRGQRLLYEGARHARNHRLSGALRYWAEATETLAGLDDVRAAAARQRHGLLLCVIGDSDRGLPMAEAEAAIVDTHGDALQRCAAASRLARALRVADRRADAEKTARRALAIADTAADLGSAPEADAMRADATLSLAHLVGEGGPDRWAEARELADRAAALYEELAPAEGLHKAQLIGGRLRANLSELDAAYALLGEAARSAEPAARAEALGLRGQVALHLGRPMDAAAAFGDAVTAFEDDDEPRGAAYAQVELGRVYLVADRPDEAVDALEDAIGAFTEDDAVTLLEAKSLLAECYADLGLDEQALVLFDEVAEECGPLGDHENLGRMRGQAADVLDRLDRDEAAAAHYELAADAFAAAEDDGRHLHNRRRAALAWHWAGQPERSVAALEAATKLSETLPDDEPGIPYEIGMMHYDGARILSAQDRIADAAGHAATAVEYFDLIGAASQLSAARTLHGRLLADLGATDLARHVLTEARDALDEGERRDEIDALIAQLADREPGK
ncbi:hypothetical protein [Cryptosporangium sp. NPDC048952]|uniref:hypothetical protein n=1 Tax=Cryptosporangium sp. NPDC048952 TaxID=3363961 RepID=UPI003714FB10